MKWIKQQLNFQSRSEAVWKFQLLVINLDFHNDLHCPIWTESREQIYRQWILIQLLQLNINTNGRLSCQFLYQLGLLLTIINH